MDNVSLFTAQLSDVFRIGLLTALMYTTENTRGQTGVIVPLLAGIVFVAIIIPATMPVAGVPMSQAIISGLAANAVLTAALWLIWSAVKKHLQK